VDTFTLLITLGLSVCIVIFGVVAVAVGLYGILVWYPKYRQKKVDALKATGRQGEATILEIPEGNRPGYVRRSVFVRTPIRLEIRVPGIDVYEVNKIFTIPSHTIGLLTKGKGVTVWVDPNAPRDLDRIVIEIK